MIAIQPKTRQILGVNQQAYQALKASMSLNLRRQLLVAVCDNVVLQNQLATQLENDLAQVSWLPSRGGPAASAGGGSLALERLVFDSEDAHLPRQVAHWVRQTMLAEGSLPQVQVLGIEQMTRQPAIIQNHFLRSLEQVEALLPRLNTSLLVWVPWPWLRTIQSSSPTFWKWRNGVFEFVSDPTPALLTSESPAADSRFENRSSVARAFPTRPLAQSSLRNNRDRFPEEDRHTATVNRDSVPINGSHNAYKSTRLHEVPIGEHPVKIEDYPHVEPHQVVALYGETDDSEFSDQGQPTLETIATWDTVDVVATTVRTTPALLEEDNEDSSEESSTQESSTQESSTQESSAQESSAQASSTQIHTVSEDMAQERLTAAASRDQSDFSAPDETSLLAAATAALVTHRETDSAVVPAESAQPEALAESGAVQDVAQQPQPSAAQLLAADWESAELASARDQSTQAEPLTAEPPTQPSAEETPTEEKAAAPSTFGQPYIRDSAKSSSIVASQQAQRQDAADDYFEVGHSYRRRIETGERGLELIEPAIAAYEGALRCLSGPHPDWGSGLNDLGTLYWLKAQQLDDQQQVIDCMSHSVQLYSQALTKIDLAESTDMACQLYSNLGAVFSMLATQTDPVLHFNKAAEAYLQALPFCPISIDPKEFATLQNSLGSVYWKLSHYEQNQDQVSLYLQQAIAAYEQAGLGYSPHESPLDYAAVQNNLGITYWSLAKHKDAVPALKNAIAAYRDALNYRTPESDAPACAITYNNLALAYWDLSKDETVQREHKLRYQRNAVTAFEAALQTATAVGTLSKVDSAAIYHCLGDVHAQMVDSAPSLTEVADSLQKSLYSYVQAIDEVSMDSPIFQTRITAIVANLRSHHEQLGLASQQAALNRVPPHLISLVMQAL